LFLTALFLIAVSALVSNRITLWREDSLIVQHGRLYYQVTREFYEKNRRRIDELGAQALFITVGMDLDAISRKENSS
jgi:predicted transcriptional regulator